MDYSLYKNHSKLIDAIRNYIAFIYDWHGPSCRPNPYGGSEIVIVVSPNCAIPCLTSNKFEGYTIIRDDRIQEFELGGKFFSNVGIYTDWQWCDLSSGYFSEFFDEIVINNGTSKICAYWLPGYRERRIPKIGTKRG